MVKVIFDPKKIPQPVNPGFDLIFPIIKMINFLGPNQMKVLNWIVEKL